MVMAIVEWILLPTFLYLHLMVHGHSEMNGMEKMYTFSCSNIRTHLVMETTLIGLKAQAQ